MHGAHEFLEALATVLCVAAVTTVLFQRLRQPVVLGYILAGLIVGPHVPVPLVADPGIVATLSEVGVILLMFHLGMEFSFRKLAEVGPTAGTTAVIQCGIMVWLGYLVGQAFGWTQLESVYTGAIIAISSTTIIAKAFEEQGIRGKLRDLVVGVLIVEDLIAILLMALLTAMTAGGGFSLGAMAQAGGKLAAFLAVLLVVGLLVVPRAVRRVADMKRPETTLVASVGLCFACALLALEFGYSVALGAFIAGSLIAESGREKEIEHLVVPVRDVFAAIFFVSVGMLIDPGLIAAHWPAVAVLTAVVIAGKLLGVGVGAFLAGSGTRTSVQAGMSLAQIGEFSFIIAGLGLSLGATREFLYPVAAAVSAITTLTTPWLIRASGPAASLVDRKMPARLQTFAALYGSWLERLRAAPAQKSRGVRVRRLAALLLLDVFCLGAVGIGVSVSVDSVATFLSARLDLAPGLVLPLVVAGTVALAAPFVVGILGLARALGRQLALAALPEAPDGKADLAAAPRRSLVVALQLAIVLVVALPLIAVTQPFLPTVAAPALLLGPLAFLGFSFWKSAKDLQGHVRAGSAALVEALSALSRPGAPAPEPHALDEVHRILPGLGEPEAIRLCGKDACVGKSLAGLDVRGVTGATVLAITRDGRAAPGPVATEVLADGDLLAIAGSHEAVEAAKALLRGGAGERP
jgi:CPA2 family monovalent cation:H+ antiporter-2